MTARTGRKPWRIAIILALWVVALSSTVVNSNDRVPLAVHPAPPELTIDEPAGDRGGDDYFDALQSLPLGALVWSQWPVRVSIDPTAPRSWQADVRAALTDWQTYVPLAIVSDSVAIAPDDLANFETSETQNADALTVDIAILRAIVPARRTNGSLRAASARASFSLFVVRDVATSGTRERFGHRFTIRINPTQTGTYVQSAVRHEFGHALGIWGHSPDPRDIMFPAQVVHRDQPPTVSDRDVNTLKRVYAQPTRLGWWVETP